MGFMEKVAKDAKRAQATVILAEAEDERVLKAAATIEKQGTAKLILLGDERHIRKLQTKLRLKLASPIMSFSAHPKGEQLAREMVLLRRHKGLVLDEARALLQDPNQFAALLVALKQADGFVSGSMAGAAVAIRPALQLLKPQLPWGATLVVHKGKTLLFADTGVNVAPSAEQLAQICVHATKTASALGLKPVVAFIGFSTKGTTRHERAAHVREAVALAKQRLGTTQIDGELALDVALDPIAAKATVKGSPVAGKANVLLFPDLHSAGVATATARALGGATTIGPIVLGAQRPLGIVRRDCVVNDVVDMVALVAFCSRMG